MRLAVQGPGEVSPGRSVVLGVLIGGVTDSRRPAAGQVRRVDVLMRRFVLALGVVAGVLGTAGSAAPVMLSSGSRLGSLLLLNERAVVGAEWGWSVIDVGRGTRERVIYTGGYTLSRSPDLARVAYACEWKSRKKADRPDWVYFPDSVCVARVDRPGVRVVFHHKRLGSDPSQSIGSVGWSPDSRRLAFVLRYGSNDNEQLWTVGADGSKPRMLASPAFSWSWSPRGSLIAYVPRRLRAGLGSSIYVTRPDGRARRLIAKGPVSKPSWSPDGSLLAYQQSLPNTDSVVINIARTNGSQRRRLATYSLNSPASRAEVTPVSWLSDGRRLAYATPAGRAFVVDVATGLRTSLGRPKAVSVSPRGNNLFILTQEHLGTTLYSGRLQVIKAGTRSRSTLVERVGGYQLSPEGTRIACTKQDGLWVVDVSTGKARRILHWTLPPTQTKGPLVW